MPPRSTKSFVVSTESRTRVPPPAPVIANVPPTESVRLDDIQFERNFADPGPQIPVCTQFQLSENAAKKAWGCGACTLDAALGAPPASASVVVHIAGSPHAPAPPFQV